MDIKFKKVILHNFGSYEHAEVELTDKGFCLVSGVNHYKKDASLSNGAGKSFLWNGINFALTGETIQGISHGLKNKLVDEEADCYTSVEFTVDNNDFIVTRYIKPKSDLKISVNGEDKSGKGIREGEKALSELLPDLSKDLIASTIIIGQGMPNKFSSFKPSDRKNLLEKLTKSEFMLSDIKDRVSNRQVQLQVEVTANESILAENRGRADELTKTIENNKALLSGREVKDYDAEIKASEALIESINKDITEANKSLTESEAEEEKIKDLIMKLNDEKAKAMSDMTTKYYEKRDKLVEVKSSISSDISVLSNEIKNIESIKTVCPTCGRPFEGVTKPDTTEKKAKLSKLNESYTKAVNDINSCDASKKAFTEKIDKSFESDLEARRKELAANKAVITKIKNDIADYSHYLELEKTKLLKAQYDKANDEKYYANIKAAIDKATQDLTEVNKDIGKAVAKKLELDERVSVNRRIDLLLKRDFRSHLLTNVVAFINSKAKEYCDIVYGTRELNLTIDGNNLDITYRDIPFDTLSGGEKQRVDLILQFALRDLLSTYLNYRSNIIVLDEIFDNLDKIATDRILSLVTNKLKDTESIFIISHHADSLNITYDTELTVTKGDDGISTVA